MSRCQTGCRKEPRIAAAYGAKLRQKVDGRAVSITLRRLATAGRLHVVREGTAHRQALYSKTRPAKKTE